MMEFMKKVFIPQFAIFTSVTLIIYITLELLLGGEKRKVGKDVTLLLSISLGFIVMFSISVTRILENIIQYISSIIIILFMGVLLFGGWLGYEEIKKGLGWKPLKAIMAFVVVFGILLIIALRLLTPTETTRVPEVSKENLTENVTEPKVERRLTIYERIIFDPKVLFTILFLLLFAAIALIIGR